MSVEEKRFPNIIFIISDDQGYWALGCAGNPEIRTPHLDRLAERGMRFDNFFCASPVCSPARASFLTGRIPSQHGVLDWIRGGNVGNNPIEYLEGYTSYTDILAENGYTCGISGKWHLGHSMKPQKGFSHWYVHQTGGSGFYNAPMVRNGEAVIEPGYITDAITDDAVQFINDYAGKNTPFYLSVNYTAPHSPWIDNHPQEIVDSYDDCPFESCPQEPRHPWSPTKLGYLGAPEKYEDMDTKENLKGYFASITAMDSGIGRILETLESRHLTENTLVCFFSDNGFNCGHHGIWGKGNGTFPCNMYDTSVKVPAIMTHPGRILEGKVSTELISACDFMPTLLEYVGLEQEIPRGLPGESFVHILEGREGPERESVVIYNEYGPVRMIRTKEWKYVHRYPFGPHELFDLLEDPEERHNLVNKTDLQDVVAKLKLDMEEWFVRFVDPETDGLREAVTGKGQIDKIGLKGAGRNAFYDFYVLNVPTPFSIWVSHKGGE